ncbi:MAG: transglutaminaseTgpA domain-containing protein [Jatrophihabitans sp.]|uniref:transglutaminase family protein n=1 Tax=Jatrophihabitans sp. TaxID=1932789 RepID=UPI00390EEF8C
MTATLTRDRWNAPAGEPPGVFAHSGARRTLLAGLGTALAVFPLKALMADNVWLVEAWFAMAVVILPAAALRARRAPGALDIWPGIVLLVPILTAMFVRRHAWGGLIPTGATLTDVGHLMNSLHHTTSDEIAPIHSTPAVRLVMCALLGLLAALIDLIAVVGRRGALAGVPLLVVYTVSGAVPRTPVAWFWFGVAAVGFLILLGLDADDELHHWGRRISRRGDKSARHVLGVSAQRIGIIAVLAAVVLPFLLPDQQKNLLADAFRGNGSNGLGSFGAGTGGGGGISPFAALKGQLDRDKPTPLMTVHVESSQPVQPFYARSNVLDKYVVNEGWGVSGHGDTEPLDRTGFDSLPPAAGKPTLAYRADITITGLTGNVPVFTAPNSVDGLTSDARWSPQDQLLLGDKVHRDEHIAQSVEQLQPRIADLAAAPPVAAGEMARWLVLPPIRSSVRTLVGQITRGKDSPYARARAITDWFAAPANNFVYSLKTTKGDSGDDLVDFLQQRRGYCQQYAAAMGVMLRLAGVPSRVVLGYMHPAPDRTGTFKITTFDAHAWVEAFFPGLGWVPFDPTPTSGLTGGKKTDLTYAPHVYPSTSDTIPSRGASTSAHERPVNSVGPSSAASGAHAPQPTVDAQLLWTGLVLIALLALLLTPAATRAGRRRRRYAAGRRGDTDALWAELSDSAVDLGYIWSPARSPRQVSAWLARDAAGAAPALDALAAAVEHQRYAPDAGSGDPAALAVGLQDVTEQLQARRAPRTRMLARFWPASLGWGTRLRRATRKLRHRH